MVQTALLVPIPRIGPLIDPWRRRHDPVAAEGIPPHVTVLWPFLEQHQITAEDVETLRQLFEQFEPFDVDLAQVGMFDEDVLHVLPEPDTPFRELTAAVHAVFPQAPPYEGRHPDPTPHVTVGHGIPRPSAKHAARSLMLALPMRVHVDVVQLWVHSGDWVPGASFPLGHRH
jgi:2'-5' RNA ligase